MSWILPVLAGAIASLLCWACLSEYSRWEKRNKK